MMNDDEIFDLANRCVERAWLELRPDDLAWRTMQPAQAGMGEDSWLNLSGRMVKRFNIMSGDHFPNVSISWMSGNDTSERSLANSSS